MVSARPMKRLTCLAFAVIAAIALVTGVEAVELKLVDMFPAHQGQNGWWLHSYEPTTTTRVELQWVSNANFQMPVVYSAGRIPSCVKNGDSIVFHPGLNNSGQDRWAVLSYVAPAAGSYTFGVTFSNAAATPGCTTKAYVYMDPMGAAWLAGTKLFEGEVTATSSAFTGLTTVNLVAGDRLRFAVSGLGDVSFDSTRMSDTPVGALPEPGSLLAVAGGLIGLFAVRRRK